MKDKFSKLIVEQQEMLTRLQNLHDAIMKVAMDMMSINDFLPLTEEVRIAEEHLRTLVNERVLTRLKRKREELEVRYAENKQQLRQAWKESRKGKFISVYYWPKYIGRPSPRRNIGLN